MTKVMPRLKTHAVDIRDILPDPRRFQYKSNTAADGTNTVLRDVDYWDPISAGNLLLFKDTDGKLYLVDGHQRYGLATRLLERGIYRKITVNCVVLEAGEPIPNLPEGHVWTAQAAMAYAARINIGQGSGSAIDAAKIARGYPQFMEGLPNNDLTRLAKKLINLDTEAFQYLINHETPELIKLSAEIPIYIETGEMHIHALIAIRQHNVSAISDAVALLKAMNEDGMEKLHQQSLFGDEEQTIKSYELRLKVFRAALKYLRRDRQTYATLTNRADEINASQHNLIDAEIGEVHSQLTNKALQALTRPVARKLDSQYNERQRHQAHLTLDMLERMGMVTGEIGDLLRDATLRAASVKDAKERDRACDREGEYLAHLLKLHIASLNPNLAEPKSRRSRADKTSNLPDHHTEETMAFEMM